MLQIRKFYIQNQYPSGEYAPSAKVLQHKMASGCRNIRQDLCQGSAIDVLTDDTNITITNQKTNTGFGNHLLIIFNPLFIRSRIKHGTQRRYSVKKEKILKVER